MTAGPVIRKGAAAALSAASTAAAGSYAARDRHEAERARKKAAQLERFIRLEQRARRAADRA